jgi:hypothetical protein
MRELQGITLLTFAFTGHLIQLQQRTVVLLLVVRGSLI